MPIFAGVLAAMNMAGASTLRIRGGEAAPAGEVVAIGIDGATVRAPQTAGAPKAAQQPADVVIGWDRIAEVEGELAADFEQYRRIADQAWRARSRLSRGDVVGAEPLFEELFTQFSGREGPTATLIASGLLRCRLSRGANSAAVVPWLALLRAGPDVDLGAYGLGVAEGDPSAAMVIDPASRLAPKLPPIWLNLPSVQLLARGEWGGLVNVAPDEQQSEPAGARNAAAIAGMYEQAARFEAGLEVSIPARATGSDGATLVWDVVAARAGDETQRQGASDQLRARLKRQPPLWVEAWCRVAIGRSLIRESDPEQRLLGIAALLDLPARLERVNPYLTGVAIAEAAVAQAELGDAAAGVRLRQDLADRLAGHPALEWEPLRRIAAPVKPAGEAGAPRKEPNKDHGPDDGPQSPGGPS